MNVLNRLLRAPAEVAAACREDRDVREIAAASIASLALGAAVFGGTIGSFRGGVQILYAGLKLPVALLATLAVCAPAFHGLAAGLGRPLPMRTLLTLTLASAGRAALVLLALAPGLWLLFDLGIGYHSAALAAAFAYALAGVAALGILLRGLGDAPHRGLMALAFGLVFFAVAGQSSWILRPYLVRPRATTVPLLRAREGSFADAVYQSSRSARGIYDMNQVSEP
jgi:hypothetical protein